MIPEIEKEEREQKSEEGRRGDFRIEERKGENRKKDEERNQMKKKRIRMRKVG